KRQRRRRILSLRAVDLLSGQRVFQLSKASAQQRTEDRCQTRAESGAGAHVLAEEYRSRLKEIRAFERRVHLASLMPDSRRGYEQDLARRMPDLRGQIGIGSELAIAFIDLPDRFDIEDAHHQGRAARIFDRHEIVACGLGWAPFAVRRQTAELRGGVA